MYNRFRVDSYIVIIYLLDTRNKINQQEPFELSLWVQGTVYRKRVIVRLEYTLVKILANERMSKTFIQSVVRISWYI